MKALLIKIIKRFLLGVGLFSLLLWVLSFTDLPYYCYYWLGTSSPQLKTAPDVIIVLGGAGMPSPDGLIRTYYASEEALKYKDAKIIIALPLGENDSTYQLNLMAHELTVKGVDSLRITYEPYGFNTRSQAINIAALYKEQKQRLSFLIISTPEHLYRAVRTFKNAGLANVYGLATFERPVDAEKAMDKEGTKDKRVRSLALRYNMWSYLNYELLVLREYTAIAYYKVKGWI